MAEKATSASQHDAAPLTSEDNAAFDFEDGDDCDC